MIMGEELPLRGNCLPVGFTIKHFVNSKQQTILAVLPLVVLFNKVINPSRKRT